MTQEDIIYINEIYVPQEVDNDSCCGCDFSEDRFSDTGRCIEDVECFNYRVKRGLKYYIWKRK